jgi:hypothetical protein
MKTYNVFWRNIIPTSNLVVIELSYIRQSIDGPGCYCASGILIWSSKQHGHQIYGVLVERMRSETISCCVDHLECGGHGSPNIAFDPFVGTRLINLVP